MTGKFQDLRIRVVSALCVALVAVVCLWFGGILIVLLAGFATVAMAVELRSIIFSSGAAPGLGAIAPALVVVAGIAGLSVSGPLEGLTLLFVGALIAFAFDRRAVIWRGNDASVAASHEGVGPDLRASAQPAGAALMAAGTVWIGAAGIALVWVRGEEPYGLLSVIWAALVVAATDIGGYFVGRWVGGPRLWPALSPKKTWAGLLGGVSLAFIVGGLFSWATTGTYFYQVCIVSMIAALVAQGGDLAESALKRRFGVKDAGTLIPGHGGVLDRLDGHMAAVLVAAVVTAVRGEAVFVW
ncbi:MAG: phosphatidate cytidylyltransferase [Pseudomonadota bacterium]